MQSLAVLENDYASVASITGFPWIISIMLNAKQHYLPRLHNILFVPATRNFSSRFHKFLLHTSCPGLRATLRPIG